MDKAKLQLAMWDKVDILNRTVLFKVNALKAIVAMAIFIIFFAGWFVGNHGISTAVTKAVSDFSNHDPVNAVERMQMPFCEAEGNFYFVKKTSNYTFTIVKHPQTQVNGRE